MVENDEIITPESDLDFRTEPEKAADDKIEALESELAALQPGVQVVLERLRPSWCKGQLEKITIDEQGLDLDYLIRTWGGHLLSIKIIGPGSRIKGSHSVELYTFEPRRYGKPLRAPNNLDDEETPAPAPNPVVTVQPPPSHDNDLFLKMFDMLNAQRASEIETLRLLIAQRQDAPAPAFGGVGELIKMAGAFNKLKEMFQIEQPQAIGNPEDAFPIQIMEMLGKFIDNKGDQTRGQLIPPKAIQGAAPPPPTSSAPASPLRHGGDLISQITSMEPDKAADVLMTALGRMPAAKQEAAFAVMKSKFQQFMPEVFEYFEDQDEAADNEDETEGVGEN